MSSAVGVSPSSVSIRRILDVTFPLSPKVLWTNPNFAGDDFSRARRRLQVGSNSTGSVSVDMQIKLVDTAAASSLSTSLSSSVSKLADDVKQSLAIQGSPLSAAEIAVTVQPYSTTLENNKSESSPSSLYLIAISASTFVAGVILATTITAICLYYKFKRRSEARVVPENYVEVPVSQEVVTDVKIEDVD